MSNEMILASSRILQDPLAGVPGDWTLLSSFILLGLALNLLSMPQGGPQPGNKDYLTTCDRHKTMGSYLDKWAVNIPRILNQFIINCNCIHGQKGAILLMKRTEKMKSASWTQYPPSSEPFRDLNFSPVSTMHS